MSIPSPGEITDNQIKLFSFYPEISRFIVTYVTPLSVLCFLTQFDNIYDDYFYQVGSIKHVE